MTTGAAECLGDSASPTQAAAAPSPSCSTRRPTEHPARISTPCARRSTGSRTVPNPSHNAARSVTPAILKRAAVLRGPEISGLCVSHGRLRGA